MVEEWKPIKGFEETHMVSNLGNVKSLPWLQKHSKTGKFFLKGERTIKPRIGVYWNGYSGVPLTKDGKQNTYMLHRLIAGAFIPNPDNKPCVNHKNGIKTDNRIENLEWVTYSENSKHSFATGLQSNKGENHPGRKLNWETVNKIRDRYNGGESSWKIYKSMPNISYTNIKDIISHRIW
jgi:hypothetical protein